MQIDWVTVAAQIVNFLVLVWLLQRLLYGPITRAMERRERRIADRLSDADKRREEAEREAERLREMQSELASRRDEILLEAREKAKALRETLDNEARKETEEMRRSWRNQVTEEKKEFLHELRIRTSHHIYDLARSALAELAGADVEAQVAERFVSRLREMDRSGIERIAKAAKEDERQVLIESAFDLPPGAKGQITKAVHELFSESANVTYARSGDLLLGIRLLAGGQTVEWSLNHYLERLEDAVAERLMHLAEAGEREAA